MKIVGGSEFSGLSEEIEPYRAELDDIVVVRLVSLQQPSVLQLNIEDRWHRVSAINVLTLRAAKSVNLARRTCSSIDDYKSAEQYFSTSVRMLRQAKYSRSLSFVECNAGFARTVLPQPRRRDGGSVIHQSRHVSHAVILRGNFESVTCYLEQKKSFLRQSNL